MFYTVECTRSTVYDWITSLLSTMKQHLTHCNIGRIKNFRFSNVISTFFFERVPILSPRVEVPPHSLWDPTQTHWTNVMRRLGEGREPTPFPPEFFHWQRKHIIAIFDYPYVGIDFHGDWDMPLPLGSAYGDIGKIPFMFWIILFFCIFDICGNKKHVFGGIKYWH